MNYQTIASITPPLTFSVCTLVTDFSQYDRMRSSFVARGFDESNSELLCVDNSQGNRIEAYAAINLFLRAARGRYVIVCHQDLILLEDGFDTLLERIGEVEALDPHWGLLGNAGGRNFNDYAIRISDPHGEDTRRGGPFPVRVMSLDENFILIRSDANLGVSSDIGGFHLYGTDLCLMASFMGYRAYVIDFHIRHFSAGNVGKKGDRDFLSFFQTKERFVRKYQGVLRSRWLNTGTGRMHLAGSRIQTVVFNTKLFLKLRKRIESIRLLLGGDH